MARFCAAICNRLAFPAACRGVGFPSHGASAMLETTMIRHRILSTAFILGLFASHSAFALDWEIERNFRYFLYPSDVAAQRVGRDLYIVEKGATPTPEALEIFMNGAGFWTAKLGEAGDLRKRWPIDWTRDAAATPFELIGRLRREEGRPPPVGANELDRRGWASLLVRERPLKPTLTGSTDTCWNPAQRLHNGCAVWGDYVRAPGWIGRVFDPDAPTGPSFQWRFAGAVPANAAAPRQFVTATQRALHAGLTMVSGDCRELRLVVPSDPGDPRSVAGQAAVTRKAPDGSQASVTVAPRDRLVIGFGDSFTSGEGNPERLALFSGAPWTGGNLPARDPDPVSPKAKDTRAQWTDRWCHRSVYSWQIRTALDAALSDPRSPSPFCPTAARARPSRRASSMATTASNGALRPTRAWPAAARRSDWRIRRFVGPRPSAPIAPRGRPGADRPIRRPRGRGRRPASTTPRPPRCAGPSRAAGRTMSSSARPTRS